MHKFSVESRYQSFMFKASIIAPIFIILLTCSCIGNEGYSLKEAGGEAFPFYSPITAIVDAGESLLLGTRDGKIAYFNTTNGLFSELRTKTGNSIYDLELSGSYIYYAVRDGGVKRVHLLSPNDDPETFVIKEKDDTYSPYDILITDNGKTIYAATSNGFYKWDASNPQQYGATIKALPKAAPMRFYSVITDKSEGIIFAGQAGIFKYDGKLVTELESTPTKVLNDRYHLADSTDTLSEGYGPAKVPIIDFKRNPRSFVVGNECVIAVSDKSIERIDLTDRTEDIITLPEKHLTRTRNKSTRAICVVKGLYVYVAPGGEQLYKIPLQPLKSEEIISICQKDDDEICVLSSNNDLYSVLLHTNPSGVTFSKPKYIRSFDSDKQVRLVGAKDRNIYANVDNSLLRFVGKRKTDTIVSVSKVAKIITCSLFDDSGYFLGSPEMISYYDISNKKTINAFKEFEAGEGLHLRGDKPDYYPTFLTKNGNTLFFSTLHNGVYSVDVSADTIRYECLIDTTSTPKVQAIETIDNAVFILTTDTLYRFPIVADQTICPLRLAIDKFGKEAAYLNRILPVSVNKVYMYSDYYDFIPGAYGYKIDDGEIPQLIDIINDALNINDAIFLNSMKYPIFCGLMGLCSNDNENTCTVIRPRLYSLQKKHAETYCWGLVTVIVVFLIFVIALFYSYIVYGKRRAKNEINKLGKRNLKLAESLETLPMETAIDIEIIEEKVNEYIGNLHLYESYQELKKIKERVEERKLYLKNKENESEIKRLEGELTHWVTTNFHSGYINKLAEELLRMYTNPIELSGNIDKFKNDAVRLKSLDDLGDVIMAAKSFYQDSIRHNTADDLLTIPERNSFHNQYKDKVKTFLAYYTEEPKEQSQWGRIFTKLDDISRWKSIFFYLPLHINKENKEGEWLLKMEGDFAPKLSHWKSGTADNTHSVNNILTNNEYGLFRLIAGAGQHSFKQSKSRIA